MNWGSKIATAATILPVALLTVPSFAAGTSASRPARPAAARPAAVAHPSAAEAEVPTGPTLAITDFAGADKEFGASLAETLQTALGQYDKFRPLECDGVREAFTRMKLPANGSLEPQQAQRLGKGVSARWLLMGSFTAQEDQVTLNARLVETASGHPVPGAAGSVVGSRQYLLSLIHRLAGQMNQWTTEPNATLAATTSTSEAYTGLIIDTGELEINRAMAPRIQDEDGRVIYPDPKHLPDLGWLQSNGMAGYVRDEKSAPRSGSNPLIVRAVDATGPMHDSFIVSREAGQLILQSNERGHFLESWAICILTKTH
jgi:TolB-like protein